MISNPCSDKSVYDIIVKRDNVRITRIPLKPLREKNDKDIFDF